MVGWRLEGAEVVGDGLDGWRGRGMEGGFGDGVGGNAGGSVGGVVGEVDGRGFVGECFGGMDFEFAFVLEED